MHTKNLCPLCKTEYDASEEFCTNDGERLVRASKTVNATKSDSAESKNSVLSSVMAKFGLKKAQITSDDSARAKHILPPSLIENGWTISGDAIKRLNCTIWPVKNAVQQSAKFVRYLTSPLTANTTYQALKETNCDALPQLLDFGTVELNDVDRASYELISEGSAESLSSWLQIASPSEDKALYLLEHLTEMLKEIQTIGLYPITMSPNQINRDPNTGKLSLNSLGALAAPTAVSDYRPELEHSSFITRLYSAPELHEKLVISEKSAVFSTGQLLYQALIGQGIDLASLRAGEIPFSTIQNKKLSAVLKGCLWPGITGRWSLDQLIISASSVDQVAPVEQWSKLGPQAASHAFLFSGQAFWQPEELLNHITTAERWMQAIAVIDEILVWLQITTYASLGKELISERNGGRSADYILVRLLTVVLPDRPATWRSLNVDDEHARNSLVHLAQRNLALETSLEEQRLIASLFGADLRGAFVKPDQQNTTE